MSVSRAIEPSPELSTVIVVPCFNEALRLSAAEIEELAAFPYVDVLFVNDGSTDETLMTMHRIARGLPNVTVKDLPVNRGKAEAVRLGMLDAVAGGAEWIGFCDADMATPASEIIRLVDRSRDSPNLSVILASRVALLGSHVERSAARHYFGRVFSTVAGHVLQLHVYDTQCGAKLFRNNGALRHALSQPFHGRWSFDVELLGRLIKGDRDDDLWTEDSIVEVPLLQWRDVDGSKLTMGSSIKSGLELFQIRKHLKAWR